MELMMPMKLMKPVVRMKLMKPVVTMKHMKPVMPMKPVTPVMYIERQGVSPIDAMTKIYLGSGRAKLTEDGR